MGLHNGSFSFSFLSARILLSNESGYSMFFSVSILTCLGSGTKDNSKPLELSLPLGVCPTAYKISCNVTDKLSRKFIYERKYVVINKCDRQTTICCNQHVFTST